MLFVTFAFVLTAMLIVVLAGCSPTTEDAKASPDPSPSQILPPNAEPDATDGPVEPAPLPTQSADIDTPIVFDTGIEVAIDSVVAKSVKAETPGEVDGSAVVVTVTARNDSTQAQSFDSAVVTVVADDGALGIGTTAGKPSPFSGELAPGKSATGTYVFMLDSAEDRTVTVSVNYAAGEPVAVFTGKVS